MPRAGGAGKARPRLGIGVVVGTDLQARCLVPCAALEHVAHGGSDLAGVPAIVPRAAKLLDSRDFADDASRLAVLTELQICVGHEILRMRLLRECRAGEILGGVVA